MSQTELYFSTDIETNGPIPIVNSMIQMGMTAFTREGIVARRKWSLYELPGAVPDPDTLHWWRGTEDRSKTLDAILNDPYRLEPQTAMRQNKEWIEELCDRRKSLPVCCADPAGFDFCFYYVYVVYLLGGISESPFQHRCWDRRSYEMCLTGKGYLDCHAPAKDANTHWADEDSELQAHLDIKLMRQAQLLRDSAARLPAHLGA